MIRWSGSGMPLSFWHAFSKSLVAVSIYSPVTWHNVSWAIDLAMRCSTAYSISDMSAGLAVPKQKGEGEANQRVVRVARCNRPVMGLPCWPLVFFVFFMGGRSGGEDSSLTLCSVFFLCPRLIRLPRSRPRTRGESIRG